ncbi:MAG: bifunctional adenosylcobinamide kinase/adenosylcobinamide-phosphate guanylyltransferase [Alphaproteobacteria bacterium]|nr:bifunctional adenosylcobinamide kinase/adenosylcobinamide-phosphate guanylyltransferase [Alphaproteobacteria bacterium]
MTLVLGGARSGKSAFAESLMPDTGDLVYIATAEPRDDEMSARIATHQKRRGSLWNTIEAPLELSKALKATNGKPALLDCLTLWLSNLMEAGRDIDQETKTLTACLQDLPGPVVIVSNEVGQGIVPDNALARQFRDHAGRLNQAVAAVADRVYFVTAGIPTQLK